MAVKRRTPAKAPEAVLFGTSLRRLRMEREWTQEHLAEIAGITLNYVGNLERGEQGPSLHVLVRLARAFDTDLPTLLADFRRDTLRKLRLG